MARCIGFPICIEMIDGDHVTCKKCWVSLSRFDEGRRLRSEYLAAAKSFKGTKLCNDAKKRLEEYLHESLSFGQRKRENIRRFTVVW